MEALSCLAPRIRPDVISVMATGTLRGLFIGALPGLTAPMGLALHIPVGFGMNPTMGFRRPIGMSIGIIAGTGSGIAARISDCVARRASKCPEKSGTGCPLTIALILGPMMGSNLRRAMLQAHDNLFVFLSGPITLLFHCLTVVPLTRPLIARNLQMDAGREADKARVTSTDRVAADRRGTPAIASGSCPGEFAASATAIRN